MAIDFVVSTYARNIYLYGQTTFEQIPKEYHIPVKQYAKNTFDMIKLGKALSMGYITHQEYSETITS